MDPENREKSAAKAVEQYGDMLFRVALVLLKNTAEAEDAVQDTVLRYLERAPSFASDEHEKAWLLRVVINCCRDRQRLWMRRPTCDLPDTEAFCTTPESSGILEALCQVPEKFRVVLLLYYVEERSMEEIARSIHRSVSAVKMRLKKGRALLEDIYRKEYL